MSTITFKQASKQVLAELNEFLDKAGPLMPAAVYADTHPAHAVRALLAMKLDPKHDDLLRKCRNRIRRDSSCLAITF